MITNIDTEVEHAHVHKDAVCGDGGGGGAPGCLYLSHTPSRVCVCEVCTVCIYMHGHAGPCRGGEVSVSLCVHYRSCVMRSGPSPFLSVRS